MHVTLFFPQPGAISVDALKRSDAEHVPTTRNVCLLVQVSSWREYFQKPDLFFGFVVLAPWTGMRLQVPFVVVTVRHPVTSVTIITCNVDTSALGMCTA